MFEIVTMEQVSTTKLVEPEHHKDLFAGLESHRVLPSRFMREGWSAIPLQDLEMCQVHVSGMEHFRRRIIKEPPEFNLTERDTRIASIRIEFLTVNRPHHA